MKRQAPKVTYTVVDPNAPRDVRKLLRTMAVEKLLAEREGKNCGRTAPP